MVRKCKEKIKKIEGKEEKMKRVSISPFSLSLKREREPASRRQESPPASSNSPPNLFLLAVSAADLKFTGNASQSWVSSSCLNLGLA